MVKVIWRTDIHVADKGPSTRKDDWLDMCLWKIGQVFDMADSVGADAVVDGGDFFDNKSPDKNSHSMIRRVIEAHRGRTPVWANVGNHDCAFGDYTRLPRQPLSVLYESGVFRPLYDDHELVITKDGITVRVVGVPYHGHRYNLDRISRVKKGKEDYLVMVCHMLASPEGGQMFLSEDIVSYDYLNGQDPDVFCFGHWHRDQGIVTLPSGKTVVNVGSLTRGSLSEDNMDRIPCAVSLEFSREGFEARRMPLRVLPMDHIFDVEKKRALQVRKSIDNTFFDDLRKSMVSEGGTSLRDVVLASSLPEKAKELAVSYLEKAEPK